MNRRTQPGYLTVEATLVFPLVLLFTVFLLFLGFYSYDRCVLEQSAYQAALRASSPKLSDDIAYETALSVAKELVSERLLAIAELELSADVSSGFVSVSFAARISMPFLTWLSEFTDWDFSLQTTQTSLRLTPAATIRSRQAISSF